MALTRRIARPLLASIFVAGGFDAVRNPEEKVPKAKAVTDPLRDQTAMGALDTETVVRINGFVQIVGGILLATGRFRRPACVFLMGSLVPTTYAGHRFWEEKDETVRAQQRMHFLKNLGLLGGLILAAVDTEGAPSLTWRTKRRVHQTQDALHSAGARTKTSHSGTTSRSVAVGASNTGRRAIRQARGVGDRARRRLGETEFDPTETLAAVREGVQSVQSAVTDRVGDAGGGATHAAQQATTLVANAVRQLEPVAENRVRAGFEVATDALAKLGERLPNG
jgi:putative oxidoreductase